MLQTLSILFSPLNHMNFKVDIFDLLIVKVFLSTQVYKILQLIKWGLSNEARRFLEDLMIFEPPF